MKKFFWVLFFLPLFSRAQSVFIDSFEGVKFGVSQGDAIKAAQSTGASLNYIDKEEELVFLSNLKVAGVRSKLAYMKFVDDHFFEGVAEFDVDKSNFIPVFNHLKFQLTKMYGYGKDFSWFEPPFYFGDV
jgi:pheromone shutdown protein TraB